MIVQYQKQVFHIVYKTVFFAANILGLWPFRFVQFKRRIKYSYPKALYSIVILCLGLFSYCTLGNYVFSVVKKRQLFGSFTLQLMTFLYVILTLASYLSISVAQHRNAKKIECVYVKCKEIMEMLNEKCHFKINDFSICLFDFVAKAIIVEFVNDYLVLRFTLNSSFTLENFIFGLLLSMPWITSRLYINVFYGVILVVSVYFRRLNKCLNDIAHEVARLNLKNGVKSKIILMEKYCDLSDQVDHICELYFRVTEATRIINSIYSFKFWLWNVTILLTFIIQILIQFIRIIELIQTGSKVEYLENLHEYATILLLGYDYFSTAYACERLVNEVM